MSKKAAFFIMVSWHVVLTLCLLSKWHNSFPQSTAHKNHISLQCNSQSGTLILYRKQLTNSAAVYYCLFDRVYHQLISHWLYQSATDQEMGLTHGKYISAEIKGLCDFSFVFITVKVVEPWDHEDFMVTRLGNDSVCICISICFMLQIFITVSVFRFKPEMGMA